MGFQASALPVLPPPGGGDKSHNLASLGCRPGHRWVAHFKVRGDFGAAGVCRLLFQLLPALPHLESALCSVAEGTVGPCFSGFWALSAAQTASSIGRPEWRDLEARFPQTSAGHSGRPFH